jgi:hypothetical protein
MAKKLKRKIVRQRAIRASAIKKKSLGRLRRTRTSRKKVIDE